MIVAKYEYIILINQRTFSRRMTGDYATEIKKLQDELSACKEKLEMHGSCDEKMEKLKEELNDCKEKMSELEIQFKYLTFAHEISGPLPLEFWCQKKQEIAKELGYETNSDLWEAYNLSNSIEREIDSLLYKRGLSINEIRDFLHPISETELRRDIGYYFDLLKKLKMIEN